METIGVTLGLVFLVATVDPGRAVNSQERQCCKRVPSRAGALLAQARRPPETPPSRNVQADAKPVSAQSTANWPPKPWPEGMIWIPGGDFTMGGVAGDSDARPDESPAHRVHVDGFWLIRPK
jgi:formylglycine-generating enzyme required for sulfatase activity